MAVTMKKALCILTLAFCASAADKTHSESTDVGNLLQQHSSASTPTLGPTNFLLFSNALHGIVKSYCRNLDDLELDTFQTYLTRQILKRDVQALRHSLHFNKLYESISQCAGRISSVSWDHGDTSNDELKALLAIEGKLELTTQTEKSYTTDKSHLVQNNIPSQENKGGKLQHVTNNNNTSSTTQNRKTTLLPKGPEKAKVDGDLKIRTNAKPPLTQPKPNPTVVDKIVHNVTQIASNFIDKSKKFFRKLFSKPIKSWFGRRKRDLTLAQEKVPFYTRETIFLLQSTTEENLKNNDDSYNIIWKSVTAEENKKSASDHFSTILRGFMHIVSAKCQKEAEIDQIALGNVLEIFRISVEEDLKEVENIGMSLKINEKLENDIVNCIAPL